MPKIQEYNLQTSASGPERQTAANVEDTGNTGTALRNAGSEIEAAGVLVDRRAGQADVADQAAAISVAHQDMGNELTQRVQNASPNDISGKNEDGSDGQSMAAKFSDYVDDKFASLPQPTTRAGREFAERQKAALKQHLVDSMGRSQSLLAGANAVHQTQVSVGSSANALEADPNGFDVALQNHSQYVDAMVQAGGLPASKAPELKQWGNAQLAQGAAMGFIKADPESGKKMLDNGEWDNYLSLAQKDRLSNIADAHIKAADTEQKRQEKLIADTNKDLVEHTQSQLIQQMYSGGAGAPSAKDIVNNPAFKDNPQAMMYMLNVMEKHTKDQLKTDPQVFSSVLNRIHASPTNPDGTPNTDRITDISQINPYLENGLLSIPDRNRLVKEIDKTPDGSAASMLKKSFLAEAKNVISCPNAMNMKDPNGPQRYQAFQAQWLDAMQKGQAAGKTIPQLLSPMLNGKANPDYVGGILDSYRQTPQERMSAYANSLRNVPAAAVPNTPVAPKANIRVRTPDGKTHGYLGTPEQAAKAGYKVVK